MSRNLMSAIAVLAAAGVANVHAAEEMKFRLTPDHACTSVRLDRGVLADVAVTDQGGFNMCTAYSTATLVDAYFASTGRKSIPATHRTSPLFLGVQYAAAHQQPTLEVTENLGIPGEMNRLLSCDIRRMPDTVAGRSSGIWATNIYTAYKEKDVNAFQSEVQKLAKTLSPVPQLKPAKEYLAFDSFVPMFAALTADFCRGFTVSLVALPLASTFVGYKYKSRRAQAMAEARTFINEGIERGVPVAVNYCKRVLDDVNVEGIDPASGLLGDQCRQGSMFLGHSSTVVGRRLLRYDLNRQSVCQYLVRNTYGTSCKQWADDASTTPKERCEGGQVWLDEDALLSNLTEAFKQ